MLASLSKLDWKRASTTLVLISAIVFVVGLVVGSGFFGLKNVKRVKAISDASSCITVWHVRPVSDAGTYFHDVTTSGIDQITYTVQYRVETTGTGSWSSWITPTETTELSSDSSPYVYRYATSLYDSSVYSTVEWRTYTNGKSGTDLSNSDTLTTIDTGDDDTLFTTLAASGPCNGDASGNDMQMAYTFVAYH